VRGLLAVSTLLAVLAVGLPSGVAESVPNITAIKVDEGYDVGDACSPLGGGLLVDVDGDGEVDPGDTVRYAVCITNSGTTNGINAVFDDVIDSNTTLSGTFKTTPIARNDFHNSVGNVGLAVPAGSGVLANDNDPDGQIISVFSFDASSFNGGDVSVAADGSFTYDPPPGFEGSDFFNYVIQDTDGNTDPATVSIAVSGMIWFVDATASCPCDGRLTNPFDDLAVTADSFDVNAADAAGDNIFVADGSYNAGLTLLNNQRLVGDGSSSDLATVTGISLPAHSAALPTFSGVDPVATSASDAITVGQNNTIRGLTVGSSGGTGIRGSSVGTLIVTETSISGGGGMDINSGNLAVTLDSLTASSSTDEGISLTSVTGTFGIADASGTISTSNVAAIDITGTGGGVAVSATFASIASTNSSTRGLRLANLTSGSSFNGGATTVTASTVDAVVLSNNAGSAFTFSDLDIDNSSTNQRGLFASTSGTLNISDGDIDGGSGRGVDVDGTALNVTLARVDSVGGSTAGIDLNTTTGSFAVIGDGIDTSVGGNGTGGTISNKTGSDGTNNGIGVLLSNATGVVLRRMQLNDFDNYAVRGDSVTGFTLANTTVSGTNGSSAAADEGSIRFTNLLGSASISAADISGGLEDNVRIVNNTGTLDRLTVNSGTTIGANSTSLGNDGILVEANISATLKVTVTGSSFTSSRGDLFQSNANNDSTMDVVFTNNTLTNSHTNIVSGGGGLTFSGGGNSRVTYDISDNTMRDALGIALNVFMGTGGSADWDGTIDNNIIGVSGEGGSGSEQAHGINVEAQGTGSHTTSITNNTIFQFGDRGIQLMAIDVSASLDATVTGNSIAEPFGSFPQEAIFGQAGAATGDSNVLCANISSNSFVGASGTFNDDFRLRQRKATTFRLPGYGGTPGDTAAVVAFVQGNNTGTPSGSATVDFPGTGSGFIGGVACNTPAVAELEIVDGARLVSAARATRFSEQNPWPAASLVPFTASGGESIALNVPASGRAGTGADGTGTELPYALGEVGIFADPGRIGGPASAVAPDYVAGFDAPMSPAASGETINVVLGTLNPGQVVKITFDVTVDASIPSNVTEVCNQGLVSGDNFADLLTDDPVPGATTDPTCTDVPQADLRIEKSDSADPVTPGAALTYTVTVHNDGPSAAQDVAVTDTLPAGVTFLSTTGCGEDPNGVPTCTLGSIASGGSAAYTISVTAPGAAGTITNSASVSSTTHDPDAADNATSEDTDVLIPVDLAITKDDGQATASPGTGVTYTIVVSNNGPNDATGATVTDTFPADLGGVTWTCAASAGSACTAAGSDDISDSVDILVGGSLTYTASGTIDASATGTLTNTATVSVPVGTGDTSPGDNSDTDSDALSPEADLAVFKSDDTDPVIVGDNIVYTVTVNNNGPSDAANVVVSDVLPGGVTLVATTGCAEDPNGVPTCSLGTIAAGGSGPYTIQVTADTSGVITNGASVTSDTADPAGGNNAVTEDTTVLGPPDLDLTKDDGGITAVPGDTVVYALTFANAPGFVATATGVEITEAVPANTTFNPGASTAGWVCLPDNSAGSICTLAVGSLAAGAGGSVDFAVDVDGPVAAGVTQIDNTAEIDDDGASGPDVNPADNSDSDSTPVDAHPDLQITKDDGGIASGPGETIVYTLIFANVGNQDATGVTLIDTVPANTTFNPASSAAGWVCVPDNSAGSVCSLAIGALAGGGGGGSADFAVDVDSPLPVGVTEVFNTAQVLDDGANGPDPTPGDNTSTDSTVVNTPPEIVTVDPGAQTVQYSDETTPIQITAFDSGVASLTLTTAATLPTALSISPSATLDPTSSPECTAVTDGFECTWTIEGQILEPAGGYSITATVDDGSLASEPATATITVEREDAAVDFDDGNPISVSVDAPAGDSGIFSLIVDVTEFDDPDHVLGDSNLAGDISLAEVSMALEPVGPGSPATPTSCVESVSPGDADPDSPFNYDVLTVECFFDGVPVNTYSVMVNVDFGGFYVGSGEDVLVVFDKSLGFTTGGGWFYWPGTADAAGGYLGDRTNYGFNVKYNKNGARVKGSLLVIRHLSDGSIIRLKSNALKGLAIGESSDAGGTFGWAAFIGKATYQEPSWPDPVGNYNFVVYVEDHGEPGAGADRFWIQVKDKDSNVEPDLSMPPLASAGAETIEGGNIVVPHETGRGRRP
jgi:uncharacterized repeat protein (TIGR01451 family)